MAQIDNPDIVLADTATKLGDKARGAVIITGSHGGRYAAYLTLKEHPRAVIHNDAGIGKDDAGIAVLDLAQALGVAGATASHASCRIGDAADMMARGTVNHVNPLAASLGVTPGMPLHEAAQCFTLARPSNKDPEACGETRRVLEQASWTRRIVLIDSASMVDPADAGQIVVAASHGALVGGSPAMALRVDAFAAVFHDAGVGIDGAGITRLPALEQRGIAGLTVSAASARIGDSDSVYEEGIISHANERARRLGARVGEPLKDILEAWASLA